jgi:hypothetical protein
LVHRVLFSSSPRDFNAATQVQSRLPARQLKDANDYSPVHGSQASSEVKHNGTGFERQINATWNCVFPDGTCFQHHAPLEGLPDKMEDCVKEENIGALKVVMEIDLHCLKMDGQMHCDTDSKNAEFDPFHTCTNDPNMLTASCYLECKNGKPLEHCTFEFDSKGVFNMSDSTVDTCKMVASCKSPYVEANAMFCSSHKSNQLFKPHWDSRPLPERGYADFGYRKPPKPVKPPESVFSEFLWAVAAVAVISSVLIWLMRIGVLPEPEKWRELRERVSVRRIGAPYRAPPVASQGQGAGGQYVAPASPGE